MYVVAYETSSKTGNFLLDHALSMDNVCNRCLFSIPSNAILCCKEGKEVYNLCKHIRKFPFQFFSKTAVV